MVTVPLDILWHVPSTTRNNIHIYHGTTYATYRTDSNIYVTYTSGKYFMYNKFIKYLYLKSYYNRFAF